MLFRIGVHLGDVIEKADGTVYGDGVNIAARLEGLAEPGGIVISDSVRSAVKGKVDASFLDQGEQVVKNIPDPLRAFKVISGSQAPAVSRFVEGESSSESIRDSTRSPAAAVPEPPGPKPFAPPGAPPTLLGRDDDLVALDHLLAQHRHVTVLGAGGIGKTSLALAAAHARRHAQRDGAAWVDLSSISEPALVCAVVARALELPVASGDHQLTALVAGLKSLDVLLVLDNAEHLIDEVARLSNAIVTGAPGVRLLVTSQVVLKVERERVFRLGPLAIPEVGTSAHDAMEIRRHRTVRRSGAGGGPAVPSHGRERRQRHRAVPASRWAGAGDQARGGTAAACSACAGWSSGWAIGSSCSQMRAAARRRASRRCAQPSIGATAC